MEKKAFFEKNTAVIFGTMICSLLWGSAFPFVKIGYRLLDLDASETASQILFAGIRFTIAGLMVILFGSITQKKLMLPKKAELRPVMVVSMFQTVGQYILYYIGLAHTSGVRGAIIIGTNVFVAILVSSLIFRQEKLTMRKVAGSIVGFLGVILINVAGGSLGEGSFLKGDLLVFLCTFCYAFSSVFMKKYSGTYDTVMISGYQFFLGGILMTIVGLIPGGTLHFTEDGSWAVLLYLSFVSAAAYTLWSRILKYNPVSKIAVYGFMNPVFGVILSAVLLKEGSALGIFSILALLLVCAGIVIVNREKHG